MYQRVEISRTAAVVLGAAVGLAGLAVGGCDGPPSAQKQETVSMSYPKIKRGAQVDDYHGTRVADPYRWLEDIDSPDTAQFVTAENALSRPYLDQLPGREKIKNLLTKLWNYERYDIPTLEGGKYFYSRNDGLQNQSVVYVADSLEASPRMLLDPNTLSKDGTVALMALYVSPDGKLVTYSTSDGGTDWKIWHVRRVDTGEDLADEIRGIKFSDLSWLPDSSGFYYSRYPLGPDGKPDDSKQTIVHLHRIGTQQAADRKIYEITDHPRRVPNATITEDGRYLIIDVFDGYEANGIYYFDLRKKQAQPVRLFDDWKSQQTFLGNRGSEFFFNTTLDAPNGRVIAVDVEKSTAGKRAIRQVVPQAPEAIAAATYVGGRIFAQYMKDAYSRVRIFSLDGQDLGEVKLPGAGSVTGFQGHPDSVESFYGYSDFLTPAAVYRYEVATNRSQLFRQPKIAADVSPYMTEQVFYQSKDGTRVPMFITRRRDLKLDGRNPLRLHGYGGFSAPSTPGYSAEVMAWLELGGVYALANLRGGNEYGEAWHEAGTKLKKQNVFDDFIAAAEYLIAKGYTSTPHLAISGRSNGGLLVGAVMVQRPELFGAAWPEVGVLDMLRYQTASANAYQWSSDYGLSEVPEEFTALYAYSPYHNVKAGACYPPTLIRTADHDDRVVPWHSFKFAAALQQAQGCANPVLLSVATRAGHGAGKPTWKKIDEMVDAYAFLARHTGMAL